MLPSIANEIDRAIIDYQSKYGRLVIYTELKDYVIEHPTDSKSIVEEAKFRANVSS